MSDVGRPATGRPPRRLYVDRFAGDLAIVLEGDRAFELPRWFLPSGTREGDWIQVVSETTPSGGVQHLLHPDPAGTAAARAEARAVLERLRQRE